MPARANVTAGVLDPYVEDRVLEALRSEGGVLTQAVVASEQIDRLAAAVEAAGHELDLFVTSSEWTPP